MSHFAWYLSQQMDRPVLDRTGLDRYYDFTLEWTPDPSCTKGATDVHDAPPSAADGPSIFTALREQLGLKLEPHTGPVDVNGDRPRRETSRQLSWQQTTWEPGPDCDAEIGVSKQRTSFVNIARKRDVN